ncbi:MAG: SUMF1/EgtB/PvdO family nonheme iron enzyme [Polyangiaceae bacterium]|nr:SUMF1/EgtB/PvdO family nonheme iron enzyme [Polyangiaceae bacterium]
MWRSRDRRRVVEGGGAGSGPRGGGAATVAVLRAVAPAAALLTWLGPLSACDKSGEGAATTSAPVASAPVPSAPSASAPTGPAPTASATATEGTASAAPSASVAPSASASAGDERGPTQTVPAGRLVAGNQCGAVPRITPEELAGEKIELGAFDIDVYPYPNEPGRAAKVGVGRDEAAALCQARGARLCTELEWERACKGPDSTPYETGAVPPKDPCKGEPNLIAGKRSGCRSAFGVMDLHGLAFEWTSSMWGRGTSGGAATVRGSSFEKTSPLELRCAYGQPRAAGQGHPDVGFRCCSGPQSPAEVALEPRKRDTLEAAPGIDQAFEASLLAAMPPDHRTVPGYTLRFDNVYYWHPVANEELVLARWSGVQRNSKPFREVAVFKICGGYAILQAHMRGPVAELERPDAGLSPAAVSYEVRTGADRGEVKLQYQHGWVGLQQPAWVKAGNKLELEGDKPPRRPPVRRGK